jgi:predicted nucleic acid-binding protein
MLLDTNIVSELMRPRPDPAVLAWFARRAGVAFYLSAVAEAELRAGLAFLPEGQRRTRLTAAFDAMMAEDFAGRVLAFDSAAARAFAAIAADRRRAGRPISTADAQIAAIARVRDLPLVTRNARDFDLSGVSVVDPWTAP